MIEFLASPLTRSIAILLGASHFVLQYISVHLLLSYGMLIFDLISNTFIQQINFDLELDPVKLLGGVEVVRSLADKKKGPKFYVHAKRKPLEAEVRIEDLNFFLHSYFFSPPPP